MPGQARLLSMLCISNARLSMAGAQFKHLHESRFESLPQEAICRLRTQSLHSEADQIPSAKELNNTCLLQHNNTTTQRRKTGDAIPRKVDFNGKTRGSRCAEITRHYTRRLGYIICRVPQSLARPHSPGRETKHHQNIETFQWRRENGAF